MSRQIICTVGTSLLTNPDGRPWSQSYREGKQLPEHSLVIEWLKNADKNDAICKTCAESNTLNMLELEDSDYLDFLHSDTPEGEFCAKVLSDFYSGKDHKATLHKIGQLGYGADKFTTGLKALTDLAIRQVRMGNESGRQPVFCATGGFKAEIAFLNLLGALLEVKVYYLHEQHRELICLPHLPLTWDCDFVLKYKDFFQWIDSEPRANFDVESRLKGSPKLRSLVETDNDGNTFLSAAADLLYKAANECVARQPRALWPKANARPPKEKNNLSTEEHHRPNGWKKDVDWLCSIDCVCSVHCDAKALGNSRVKVLDGKRGIIGVLLGKGSGNPLPLRVETTARIEAETELVADYLKEHIK